MTELSNLRISTLPTDNNCLLCVKTEYYQVVVLYIITLLNALLKHIYLRRLLVRLFIYLFLNIVILPGNFTGF